MLTRLERIRMMPQRLCYFATHQALSSIGYEQPEDPLRQFWHRWEPPTSAAPVRVVSHSLKPLAARYTSFSQSCEIRWPLSNIAMIISCALVQLPVSCGNNGNSRVSSCTPYSTTFSYLEGNHAEPLDLPSGLNTQPTAHLHSPEICTHIKTQRNRNTGWSSSYPSSAAARALGPSSTAVKIPNARSIRVCMSSFISDLSESLNPASFAYL